MAKAAAAAIEPVEEVVEESQEVTLAPWRLHVPEELYALAGLVGNTRELWDDVQAQDPVASFQNLYLSSSSVVFEIGDKAGMLAVVDVRVGFRGTVVFAGWKPEGMRVPKLWRAALASAMLSRDLIALEGRIATSNQMSRKVAELVGFKHQGTLLRSASYNGKPHTLEWYMLRRADLGIEE